MRGIFGRADLVIVYVVHVAHVSEAVDDDHGWRGSGGSKEESAAVCGTAGPIYPPGTIQFLRWALRRAASVADWSPNYAPSFMLPQAHKRANPCGKQCVPPSLCAMLTVYA